LSARRRTQARRNYSIHEKENYTYGRTIIIDHDAAVATATRIGADHGVPAIGVRVDIVSTADVQRAVAEVARELGPITALVNKQVADTDYSGIDLGWRTGIAFIVGAACSMASGIIGMFISVRSNVRTAASG